jgi:hypothetical protein
VGYAFGEGRLALDIFTNEPGLAGRLSQLPPSHGVALGVSDALLWNLGRRATLLAEKAHRIAEGTWAE